MIWNHTVSCADWFEQLGDTPDKPYKPDPRFTKRAFEILIDELKVKPDCKSATFHVRTRLARMMLENTR